MQSRGAWKPAVTSLKPALIRDFSDDEVGASTEAAVADAKPVCVKAGSDFTEAGMQ